MGVIGNTGIKEKSQLGELNYLPERFENYRIDEDHKNYNGSLIFSDGSMIEMQISEDGHIKHFVFETVNVIDPETLVSDVYKDLLIWFPRYDNEKTDDFETIRDSDGSLTSVISLTHGRTYDQTYFADQANKQIKTAFRILSTNLDDMDKIKKLYSSP